MKKIIYVILICTMMMFSLNPISAYAINDSDSIGQVDHPINDVSNEGQGENNDVEVSTQTSKIQSADIQTINEQSTEDLDENQYTVEMDEDFQDGVMSNPDGNEGTGYEVTDEGADTIFQSRMRGAGYDLTWTTKNGVKVMLDGYGNQFGYGACKKVIDVSSYDGTINWTSVKNSGVDGAILRCTSFSGGTMHEDDKFKANLDGCRKVGMPFGIYMYSYATNTTKAKNEANYVISLLKKYNVKPSELKYPVYYDLEGNKSTQSLSVSQNVSDVKAFVDIINANGYNVGVYSYTSYLNNNLNSPEIHKYTSWVAQYGKKLTFVNNYYKGNYGWQYRDNGTISGISGDVDVSCFAYNYNQSTTPSIQYRGLVQGIGWQGYVRDGATAGTVSQYKRMEAIKINLVNNGVSGSVQYSTHVQKYGWQDWKNNNQVSGTEGQSLRIEAIKIKLTGDIANKYDIYYRVHAQHYGWLGWTKNGASAGTQQCGYRIEGIQIKLVNKGGKAPGSTARPFIVRHIAYTAHLQTYGWQSEKYDGELAGTTGQYKRVEGLKVRFSYPEYSGKIQYRSYGEKTGWETTWKTNNQLSGTTGKSRRLEAIQVKLTGTIAEHYDVYYRVHIQHYGWLGWTKNGASAGSIGYNYRIEGVEIKMVSKGAAAPGSTDRSFLEK